MHSKVRLIGVTEPYADEIVGGREEMVAYIAKVSNPTKQADFSTAQRLLKYLVRNAHWSPFEMVNVVLEIETPRDIARQILRHRSYAFQEFSQRYADPTKSMGFVIREARLQDAKNRQSSIEIDDEDLQQGWAEQQRLVQEAASNAYAWARARGIALECARVVMPEGNTMSRLYMNGTLRSWIHYCDLRMGNGTQKEHQEVARQAWTIITTIFPSLLEILEKHKPDAE